MNVNKYSIRSDFADEFVSKNHVAKTYTHEEKVHGEIKSNYIQILEEKNELGKEVGDYVSIQFPDINDHEIRETTIFAIRDDIKKMMDNMKVNPKRILVVGLGNRFITSDALGPQVANEILVTAHYYRHQDQAMMHGTRDVAVLTPGVMGQTGLESLSIVKGVVEDYQPDLIIAVDALATRNIARINRVVQVNNTGIQPGSGVGNHRTAFNEDSLHVPVIAIGVATVTSIGAILNESLELMNNVNKEEILQNIQDQNHLDLVVTPKAMDDELKHLVYIVSESLNHVIHPDYGML